MPVVVVLVFVIGEEAVQALADHAHQGVPGERRIASVLEGIGKLLREADLFVELADGEEPGVAGESGLGDLEDDRFGAWEIEDKRKDRLSTHVEASLRRSTDGVFTSETLGEALCFDRA